MRLKTLLAATVLLAAACAPQKVAEVAAPSSVDRMAKTEVEAIVKEYLLKNPEVLVEAFNELDRRHTADAFTRLTSHDNDPSIGPKNAPITIVEFFDYNCGYCKAANEWVMKEAGEKNGQVRVVFKEYPILRQASDLAAKASLAAERQGKYREMHIALMKSRGLAAMKDGKEDLEAVNAEIERIGKSVGLNIDKLRKDMADPAFEAHIERVHREAAESGVDATPGFYINGQSLQGFDEKRLDAMIDEARKSLKS
ncbi:MAG: DsbA family protein [Hyphomonadaceae bacterium]|nr:DsbA family protein [Hyphomonadaceae bacterium]